MERFVEHLEQLVPQARFAMAHGQMHEATLEKAMLSFYEGETDVLVCSTIIESGLDIPTANTMIIIDADRLGLAPVSYTHLHCGGLAPTPIRTRGNAVSPKCATISRMPLCVPGPPLARTRTMPTGKSISSYRTTMSANSTL